MNGINFKILKQTDLPLLHKWHNEPHVKQWYDKDRDLAKLESVVKKYTPYISGTKPTQAYIIVCEAKPIGYLQTYLIKDYPDYAKYLELTEEAAGIDLFIGDKNYIHKGLGAKAIKQFLSRFVFSNPVIESCIVGPEPKNTSAIRAYEKAGFKYLKTIQVSNESEPEYLMRVAR
jgi:RimJ/RimL family protein N-acetyltransferase